jgi:transcription initiation factor TFIID TATA-box-binding protein
MDKTVNINRIHSLLNMNARMTNVVVSANLHCAVNLNYMVNAVNNAVYNPKKYSGMIWRHRRIKSKCFLFHTGNILCMGNDTVRCAKNDLRKYARLLTKKGYVVCLKNIKVVTKSAVATLSGKLDIKQAVHIIKGIYEPELFQALMFRKGKTHFTCFPSGKVVMTGVKAWQKIFSTLMTLELFTL